MPSNTNASSAAATTQPMMKEEEDLRNFSLQIHKMLVTFNGMILSFLQIKFQFSKTSPFGSPHHPIIISFFAFTLVYVVLHLSEFKLQRVPEIQRLVGNISHLFGAIATILLLSIISPVFALCLLPFTVVWFVAIAYGIYSEISKSKSPPGHAEHINSQV